MHFDTQAVFNLLHPTLCCSAHASSARNQELHHCSFQATVTFNVAEILHFLAHDAISGTVFVINSVNNNI